MPLRPGLCHQPQKRAARKLKGAAPPAQVAANFGTLDGSSEAGQEARRRVSVSARPGEAVRLWRKLHINQMKHGLPRDQGQRSASMSPLPCLELRVTSDDMFHVQRLNIIADRAWDARAFVEPGRQVDLEFLRRL